MLTETDLKGVRPLVTKYGDRMQPHVVDSIKGTMTDGQIADGVIVQEGRQSVLAFLPHLRSAPDTNDRLRAVRPRHSGARAY